jgi:hypothetical protein
MEYTHRELVECRRSWGGIYLPLWGSQAAEVLSWEEILDLLGPRALKIRSRLVS